LKNELGVQFAKIKAEVAGEESYADSGGAVTKFKVSMLDVKIILERILKREILKFAAQMDERPSDSASMING
jgi:hypothetical protein